jgi:threonine dehydrogenase-like Zn-dependent dehydrogenase
MKAIYFNGSTAELINARKPRPRRGEALIRVDMAGICATDLIILQGYMDFRGILGHEFVGTVVSSENKKLVGKRITGEIFIPCRKCDTCLSGREKHCPTRTVIGIDRRDGAFAEFLTLPNENLHVVPESMSDEKAVFVELVAAACEIPIRVPFEKNSRVAVLGDGRLAAMAAQVVARESDDVLVLGLNAPKLEVIGALGIRTEQVTKKGELAGTFDIAVDCTGKPNGLPLATELVHPQGTIVLKSTYNASLDWNPAPIVVNELTVVGSRCGPFETALELIDSGEVKIEPFLTAVYELDDWENAFRRARRSESFKVALRPQR